MRPKRLLICSSDVPHPTRGAGMVVLYQYVHFLNSKGFEILHWVVATERATLQSDADAYRKDLSAGGNFKLLLQVEPQHYEERSNRAVFRSVRAIPVPAAIQTTIEQFAPDRIFAFDIHAAAMTESFATTPRTVWIGDLNFQTFWYHAWYAFRENRKNIVRLPLAACAAYAWRRFYVKTLRTVPTVIVCAKSSEKILAKSGIRATYLPYPWPALPQSHLLTRAALSSKPTFLFLGNLIGLGSRSALHFLVGPLYSELRKQWGAKGFEISICGTKDLPPWVKPLLEDRPEIRCLGFVENLETVMNACHAVIAPIDVPVGNRTRIVTGMAAGTPVIAHSHTAFGNPDLVDGRTCLLSDNPQEFAKKMKLIFEDSGLRARLAGAALTCYKNLFSPETASAKILPYIEAGMAA